MQSLNLSSMESVAQFVLAFLDRQFSFDEAYQQFGPAREEDEDLIEIEPFPKSALEEAELEKLQWEPDKPPLLTGITLEFKAPLLFDFDKLAKHFGQEREAPRLKLDPPIPYQFSLKNNVFEGYLLLSVPEEARLNRVRKVERLIVRRFPRYDPKHHPRSVGMCVLVDLAVTENPDPYFKLVAAEDMDKALAAWRPRYEEKFPNLLGGPEKQLTLRFAPTEIDAFNLDQILRSTRPLGNLVLARERLLKFVRRRKDAEEVQDTLAEAVLEPFRPAIDRIVARPDIDPAPTVQAIDQALSAQAELFFASPAFKAFQAHWLGLRYLAECLEAQSGAVLEVFPVQPTAAAAAFKSRWLHDEHHLTEGVLPLLALIQDAELDQRDLLTLSQQTYTVVVGGALTSDSQSLRDDALGRSLAIAQPRVCLRPALNVPGCGPTCFTYSPTKDNRDTTVWGSGAWAFAALCAASQAKLGRIEPQSVSIPLPPLMREAPDSVPVLEPLPASAAGGSFTILKHNKAEKTISLAKLSALNESTKPDQKLAARLIFNPLVQIINRLRYLHAVDTNPRGIVEPLRKALQARIPDSMVDVDAKGGKLLVQVIPAFEVAGKLTPFKYDQPWPEPRP